MDQQRILSRRILPVYGHMLHQRARSFLAKYGLITIGDLARLSMQDLRRMGAGLGTARAIHALLADLGIEKSFGE